MDRPDWINYYLGIAKLASTRSHDAQTKHGCVIVDSEYRTISTGYNGFCKNLKDDSALPNTRPEKYPFMLHAEENAICNARNPVDGCTAFVTGLPCLHCTQLLWQNGVNKVYYIDAKGWAKDDEEKVLRNLFLSQCDMEFIPIKPDFEWIYKLCSSMKNA